METIRILLDTSAYIAFLKGHPGIKQAIQKADEINLNPVVMGELLAGFMKGRRAAQNREILQEFMGSPRVRLMAID
jgi:predicted nucleic acid-binding protein